MIMTISFAGGEMSAISEVLIPYRESLPKKNLSLLSFTNNMNRYYLFYQQ